MNKFKAAQQNNKRTEKISDLMKAGVEENLKEETKAEKEPTVAKQESKEAITAVKEQKEESINTDESIADTSKEDEIRIVNASAEESHKISENISVTREVKNNIQDAEYNKVELEVKSEENFVSVNNNEDKSEVKTTEIHKQESEKVASEPITKVVSNITHEEPDHESVIETPVKKKKIPNIFSQKEESKSVRKSLVLKPTSVKKAENYCNKNGGSFNELIQKLLDNFIEEYDL